MFSIPLSIRVIINGMHCKLELLQISFCYNMFTAYIFNLAVMSASHYQWERVFFHMYHKRLIAIINYLF